MEFTSKFTTVPKKAKISDFKLGSIIGVGKFKINKSGSLSKIRYAKNIKTNKEYAAKIVKKSQVILLRRVDHIFNEITILSNLNSPYIVNKNDSNKGSYRRILSG